MMSLNKYFLAVVLGILMLINCNTKSNKGLEIGDRAPQFSAKDQDGDLWNSNQYYGEKNLIVYFYPAAMTAGCTKQACTYRDNIDQLQNYDAKIVGISGDKIENLKIFQQENNLNFTLLSDPGGKVAKKFGVPTYEGGKITRNIDGEEVELTRGSTHQRWTFVINKKGDIVYKDTEVDVTKDSENVLKLLKKLD